MGFIKPVYVVSYAFYRELNPGKGPFLIFQDNLVSLGMMVPAQKAVKALFL